MIAYYGSKISEHMTKTPEGFLICHDVPIARIGQQEYLARELGLDGDPDRPVAVQRCPEDVFDPAAVASFEGKDVTQNHPPESLTPENHALYAKGHAENVRREGDYLVADLHLKDPGLISDVENGVTREVSCGYLCRYTPDGAGYRQTNIRGNHVAIVPRGRAGHLVAIQDSAGTLPEKGTAMNEPEKKPAPAAESNAQDAAPASAPEAEPAKDAQPPAAEPAPAEDSAPPEPAAEKPAENSTDAKLDKILAGITALVKLLSQKTQEPAQPPADADPGKEDDGMDGLLSGITKAAQDSAAHAAHRSGRTTYEAACEESQAAYDAFNPHKHKEA